MEYTIGNEYLQVRVCDAGAELQSVKSADGTEYLWQGDPKYWKEKAPNIFPYVARLTQGTYFLNGEPYNMQIHGLVKYRTLEAEAVSKQSISFCLRSDEQTREQYPFAFVYRITYSLNGRTLGVTITVENPGGRRMFFAVGGHPGFRVPLEEELKFEDYFLEFESKSRPCRVGFTENCFLSGRDEEYRLQEEQRIPLRHSLFDHDALVLKDMPKSVRLASPKGRHSVTVRYPDFPYIGFWHMPRTEANYVCIEPWTSLPSRDGIVEDLSCQSDLIGLDAQGVYHNSWEISFD